MDILEIKRLRVRTEVGFSPHELGKKQELNITIHLRTSIKKAGETDRVEDTINYRTITKDVLFHVENKSYNLIEAVATDVARICVVRHGVPSVKVIVEKPNALRFSESSSVTIERRWEDFDWHEAHISIGSNIEPEKNLSMAMDLLKEHMKVLKVSKAFKTTPVGDKKQADFLNMAALVKTKLGPAGLKQVLSQVEHKLGRKRDPNNKNAPRTIDLDISFWGNMTCDYKMNVGCATKTWALPDPDTLKYAHVIIPLADVTPEFIHPTVKKPLRLIAQEVSGLDDFHCFFPVTQKISANEVHSFGVDASMVFPGILKSKKDAVEKPITNGIHLKDFHEPESGRIISANHIHSNGVEASMVLPPETLKSKDNGVEKPFKNGIHLNGFHEPGSESPVALVTGAAKRLGACIAIRLHEKGYNVLVHYNTSTTESTDLVKQLNSIRLNSAKLIRGDLGHNPKQTADRIVDEALRAWGRLDLLVNNASQFHQTEVGEITEEEWNGFMAVNLSAPFFLSQAAFPSLKASGGSIVNILDIHADRPLTHHSVYCISKAGLLMCTMALAKEFAPFVRVNGVSPGAILWPEQAVNISTEGAALESKQAEILKKVPMNRRGEPSDITQAVEYLACACSAGYVTGQVIRVDGGRTLNQ